LNARIDDPALDVDANSVLVLRNAGPKGAPGMPEWGNLPIPQKLLKAGVRDMVRISDARMSGTSYGACVLHVAPESFVGGPLALLKEGDIVELDVAARQLNMRVSERSWLGVELLGGRRTESIRVATGNCFSNISSKLMRAATSIFSKARQQFRNQRSIKLFEILSAQPSTTSSPKNDF